MSIIDAYELEELQDKARALTILAELRESGWCVAVHNDYRQNGKNFTFWLMTHECGLFLKGEGSTDLEAIRQIEQQARRVFAPSP